MIAGIRLLCVAAGVLCVPVALAQHAHVHGTAKVQVAVDPAKVVVELESPLDNLVGFERAPRNDKERAALESALAKLRQPEALFALSADAKCTLLSAEVTPPEFGAPKAGQEAHAEASGRYEYRCERIDAMRAVEVKVFDAFRGIRRVDAAVAGPRGQAAAKLTGTQRRVAW